MAKYRKRPVEVEAVQWTGNNIREIESFCSGQLTFDRETKSIIIHTLEGNMTASDGDFIIRGVHGEYYPCKPDIFEKTYEPVF